MPEVHEALDEQEIALCFPVVQTLRVHFTCQADFVSRVVRQQADGYHLMYIADGGQVQAIAGYRIREHLETPDPRCAAVVDGMLSCFPCACMLPRASHMRRYMYVADLATLPAKQGAGYGKALMARLEQIAREAGCKRCGNCHPCSWHA
jgi:GNAT superfamily N-acetyltransferase